MGLAALYVPPTYAGLAVVATCLCLRGWGRAPMGHRGPCPMHCKARANSTKRQNSATLENWHGPCMENRLENNLTEILCQIGHWRNSAIFAVKNSGTPVLADLGNNGGIPPFIGVRKT